MQHFHVQSFSHDITGKRTEHARNSWYYFQSLTCCDSMVVQEHKTLPFLIIRFWTPRFWTQTTVWASIECHLAANFRSGSPGPHICQQEQAVQQALGPFLCGPFRRVYICTPSSFRLFLHPWLLPRSTSNENRLLFPDSTPICICTDRQILKPGSIMSHAIRRAR